MRSVSAVVGTLMLLFVIGAMLLTPKEQAVRAQPGSPPVPEASPSGVEWRDAGEMLSPDTASSDVASTVSVGNSAIELEAIGTAFMYQGRLTDGTAAGQGNYDLTFRLYPSATGGSPIGGLVTREGVPLVDGIFTVELDFGAGSFDGTERFLEIGVRRSNSGIDYVGLNPRQPIRATPYASYAENAGNLAGVPGSAYLRKWIGSQFRTTLAPGETQRWFTHSWSTDEIVTWGVYPISPGGRVTSSVEIELESSSGVGNGKIKYYIVITNIGSVTTEVDARYIVFR